MGFFSYIASHWYVGLALVLLIILTVFVWIMALVSGRKRREERERIIAELEKEKALRKEFKVVDNSTFAEDKDDYRLVIGMCAHIQQRIEKEENMNDAFMQLAEVERYVYALGYVFEDSRNGFSGFFRLNGEPLVSVSVEAVDRVIGGEFSELFQSVYRMFDDDDEAVSVDEEFLQKADEKSIELIANDGSGIFAAAAEYIRSNKNHFIS
ncbi:MAG: hypothetical protein IK955_01490 [Clostridia bacterium]|nr:hypothetical protein [Clostridia bacterium]